MTYMVSQTTSIRNSLVIDAVIGIIKQITNTDTFANRLAIKKAIQLKHSEQGMAFYITVTMSSDNKIAHISVVYYPPGKNAGDGVSSYVVLHRDHAAKMYEMCGKSKTILVNKNHTATYLALMRAVEYRINQNFLEEQFG